MLFIPQYDIGNMTGAACGAGTTYMYHSGGTDFTSGFHKGLCFPIFCVSCFYVIVLSFVFWFLIVPLIWLRGIFIFFTVMCLNALLKKYSTHNRFQNNEH